MQKIIFIILLIIFVLGLCYIRLVTRTEQVDKDRRQQNLYIEDNVITNDYIWVDDEFKKQYDPYEKAIWQSVSIHKLDGFLERSVFIEKHTTQCGAKNDEDYLRREGGICGTGYWLENTNANKITTIEQLKKYILPIDTDTLAISFIAAIENDLEIDGITGIIKAHTLKISDGYLIQLIKNNKFGCSNHVPSGIIYKITTDGIIEVHAREKKGPDTESCKD